jgi:hypothetical protein
MASGIHPAVPRTWMGKTGREGDREGGRPVERMEGREEAGGGGERAGGKQAAAAGRGAVAAGRRGGGG